MAAKRLYRAREGAIIGGVCAGLAEYFDTDPVLIRLAAVLLFFAGGVGLLSYIVAWIIMPGRPLSFAKAEPEDDSGAASVEEHPPAEDDGVSRPRLILGIAFIVIGFLALLGTLNVWSWFSVFKLWPVIIILIGILIITRGMEKEAGHEN